MLKQSKSVYSYRKGSNWTIQFITHIANYTTTLPVGNNFASHPPKDEIIICGYSILSHPRQFLRCQLLPLSVSPHSDTPFTIIVPKVDTTAVPKDRQKEFVLEHMVPGVAFLSFSEDDVYGNELLHKIEFTREQADGQMMWSINGVKILRMEIINERLSVIFIDGVLGDKKGTFAKRNIQETNRYNEPQRLEMKNPAKHEHPVLVKENVAALVTAPAAKEEKGGNLMGFLANMKSGTKVFQHFLAKTNLTHILDGELIELWSREGARGE